MPAEAVDELLAALEEAPDEQPAPEAEQKSNANPVRDLRKFADTVLKEKKQSDAQVLKLQEELAKYKASEEASVFTQLGLDEKRQKLFKAVNPEADVTKEAVEGFMQEYGIAVSEGDDVDTPVQTPTADAPQAPFAPVHTPGTAPDATSYSSDDLIKMIMSGQTEQAHSIVTRATRQPNLITFKHADKMPA